MDNKSICKEINIWEKEEIISPEQANILRKRYPPDEKNKTSVPVFAVIGSVFLAVGGVVIAAAFWKELPYQLKLFASFLPLLAAQILAVYSLIRKNDSTAMREGVSVFYTIGIFTTYKLTELIYNTPPDYVRYIVLCALSLFPVLLIFRSVVAGAAYLFAVCNWAFIIADSPFPSFRDYFLYGIAFVMTLAGIIYIMKVTEKENNIFRTFALWASAASFFAAVSFFSLLADFDTVITVLLMFIFLFALTKKDTAVYSPYYSAGKAGSFTVMLLVSAGVISTVPHEHRFSNIIFIILLSAAAGAAFIYSKEYSLKKSVITVSGILMAVTTAVAELFIEEPFYPKALTVILSLIFLGAGITYIVSGGRENRISDINLGIISVFSVIISLLSKETGSFIKGSFFFILGIIFILVNIFMNRRIRASEIKNETGVEENEK